MIIVNSPLMHKEIEKQLELNEEPSYTFVKKEGIKLYFETDAEDSEKAVSTAKQIIKNKVSDVIMVKVKTEEYL
ncbi:hypothetical protein SAMN02745249_01858 [Atopostipes suicloacalis DSM 15692]|uniref:Uncharacterized protein n=1 Tax=Atopostipes suicloacalis DSM 15692 TaxID=1121025 RepID=A0A1M4Z365_9LACT|nr:hypothetical protein [Atopostipes suicloacalis]SHF12398.1 hypothetical protein SAMN02745249_01858 [Atopostipes suicloacalis DSM 15692]